MTGVDLSALPSKMKDYALKDNNKLLRRLVLSEFPWLKYATVMDNVTDEVPLTQVFTDEVLQPGGKDTYNAKGGVGFKARVGKVRGCKIDYSLTHKQILSLRKSYLGKVNNVTAAGVYDVPFQQFLIDRVIERGKNDLIKKAYWKGQYNPDGSAAVDVFDGLLKVMRGAGVIPAGNIFDADPITGSNAVDQFEGTADLVDSDYDSEDLVMLVSPGAYKLYCRDFRSQFQSLPYNNKFDKVTIEGTNIEIVADPSLAGMNNVRLITLRGNVHWLCDSMSKNDLFIIEQAKRTVDVMVDFEAAPEIAIGELIWTTDLTQTQALV